MPRPIVLTEDIKKKAKDDFAAMLDDLKMSGGKLSYRVASWTHNGAVVTGNTTNTFTVNNVQAVQTVAVEFEAIPVPVITSPTDNHSTSLNVGGVTGMILAATNSPTSWAINPAVPAPFIFDTVTGTIHLSATNAIIGVYHFTLTASNAGGTSAPVNFTITVYPFGGAGNFVALTNIASVNTTNMNSYLMVMLTFSNKTESEEEKCT